MQHLCGQAFINLGSFFLEHYKFGQNCEMYQKKRSSTNDAITEITVRYSSYSIIQLLKFLYREEEDTAPRVTESQLAEYQEVSHSVL